MKAIEQYFHVVLTVYYAVQGGSNFPFVKPVLLLSFKQAYRIEPLISGEYTNIPPVQLHRFDSKQSGYSEAKPSKTGAAGKWGTLFATYRASFSKQKAEEEASDWSASPNSEENTEEDDVVIVHNAASVDSTAGRIC